MATRKYKGKWLEDKDEAIRAMANPVQLIENFLQYFKIDLNKKFPDRVTSDVPVPREELEELAERFAVFLYDKKSLDEAFGGSTERKRQKWSTDQKALDVTGRILAYCQAGDTFDAAIERVAGEIPTSVANIKKLYTSTRPEWDRKGRKFSKKE